MYKSDKRENKEVTKRHEKNNCGYNNYENTLLTSTGKLQIITQQTLRNKVECKLARSERKQ